MTTFDRHYRRVLMTQARVFKKRGDSFYRDLVMWARRRGRSEVKEPEQMEMFA